VVVPRYAQLRLFCQPHRRPLRSYTLLDTVGVPTQSGAVFQASWVVELGGPALEEAAAPPVGFGDGLGEKTPARNPTGRGRLGDDSCCCSSTLGAPVDTRNRPCSSAVACMFHAVFQECAKKVSKVPQDGVPDDA
jgi:hypothetical protein